MKRVIARIAIFISGIGAIFGFGIGNVNANLPPKTIDTTYTQNITEQTPLYLFHAEEITLQDNNLIAWHYSHASHASHASHYSHYSSYY